jgi:DNA repair protein RadD
MLTCKSKKGNFFKDIIHVGQVREMTEMGFWSPLTYKSAGFDGSLLVYNSSKSEYTEDSVLMAFEANNIHGKIKQQLDENSDRKHILVFVPSVREAVNLSRLCPNSAAIYGDMDKSERARIIDEFKNGKIRVIFNVRVLSTGFDYTGIDGIILGISTASVSLYYQIIGRATRIDDGKKDALIVDLAGNVARFGRVEDIVFEKGTIWRMFGTGGKLLSGIPIHDLGKVTKEEVSKIEGQKGLWGQKKVEVMPFGKYKGERIANTPVDYRQWMLGKFEWTAANESLKRAVEESLKKGGV